MIYPISIKDNDLIGITALSSGLENRIEDLERSLNNLNNFKFIETDNVRGNSIVSSNSIDRVNQFNDLLSNKDVKAIFCATGGDFCLEVLDKLDLDLIKNNPKWIMGYSDPTSILYLITTKLDIATMYGLNMTGFSTFDLCHKNCIDLLKGNMIIQNSYDKYDINEGFGDYVLDGNVYWESDKDIEMKGRIIGGCFDVLLNLLGTPYDYTKEFLEKYKDDGIIWYFDNFAKNTGDFYLGLLQMKYAGWFKYAKGIIIGRVKFPMNFIDDFDYFKAAKKIFGDDFNIINNADIGHVYPKMSIINGSVATVKCSNGKGSIKMEVL